MSAINPLLMLLEELLARVDELEGQVSDLEQALHLDATANVQAAFDISETLAQLLIMLADGKPRNKERLHAALYYRRPDIDAPDTKIMDGLVCKLRKHVEPFGVEIATVWGSGYLVTDGLDVVRAAIERGQAGDQRTAAERKRDRERERQRLNRAAQGRLDRKTYEERSLSRQRPWEGLGISRRQWERRRAAGLLAANSNALATSSPTAIRQVAA